MTRRVPGKVLLGSCIAIAGVAVVLTPWLTVASGERTYAYRSFAYQVSVRPPNNKGAALREWVAPGPGAWDYIQDGREYIWTGTQYEIIDLSNGNTYVRTGSSSFIGALSQDPALLAVQASFVPSANRRLASTGFVVVRSRVEKNTFIVRVRGHLFEKVTITKQMPLRTARRQGIFRNADDGTSFDTEVPVGSVPTVPVVAYWLGPTFSGHTGVTAVEHEYIRSSQEIAAGDPDLRDSIEYSTFYELNGTTTTSASPDQTEIPDGQITISCEPVGSAHAQKVIAAMNGQNGDLTYSPFPSWPVTLANGEHATVYQNNAGYTPPSGGSPARVDSFFVVTSTTMIAVAADLSVNELTPLASLLRPV